MVKVVVVGAGIVGLAVAELLARQGDEVTVLEKESGVARHQTGRNSGVIHSGLYYQPSSHKAVMCRAGSKSMREFAEAHGVASKVTGKLVVAVTQEERTQLARLAGRAEANGVPTRMLGPKDAREIEPHVNCVEALHVKTTGIVDYSGVCRALRAEIEGRGGELRFDEAFERARTVGRKVRVATARDELEADYLINCAGLYSDRVAIRSGVVPEVRIVPFRGEYFELVPEKSSMVNGLIYPVPDPKFPFLGVHLTKTVDGGVHAGPNAVLALAREGYRWRDIKPAEVLQSMTWPGLWRLGARNIVPATKEVLRSMSKRLFAQSLARLVPGIHSDDLVAAPAGVRAQALTRAGSLVDDFRLQPADRQLHVLNAPSPAATSALEIAKHIVTELEESMR